MDNFQENHKEFIKNQLISKSQKKIRNEKNNVFTEDVSKIARCPNDDKRIQSKDSTETYAYKTNEEVIHKRKKLNVTI